MAFVDIAYLRKSDIQNDMICYTRHKTGQLLCIRLEPSIRTIIGRYEKATENSPYVFPILTTDDRSVAYRQYLAALNNHNRLLHKLSGLLLAGCKITSYTSRHSWRLPLAIAMFRYRLSVRDWDIRPSERLRFI